MQIRLLIICCLLAGFLKEAQSQGDLIACGDDQVIILDSRQSGKENASIKWSWKVPEAKELPQAYQKWLVPLDECKPVDKGQKLLLTSSGGGVVLLDVQLKKVLFYAHVPMAHSAEILPGNRVAVVLSTHSAGNSIELYDIVKPEQRLYRDSLYSGHGVIWNNKYKRVYVLGFDELRCYAPQAWNSSAPFLKLEKSWKLPDKGGHDLSAVNDNEMLVSIHDNVYRFNIKKEQFTVFDLLKGKHDIKSVNYNEDKGTLVFTQAEESWWTHNIYIKNPDKTITIPQIKLYKVRTIR